MNENGTPVEYLVVNQGIPSASSLYDASCDGTWLLRKDIYITQAFNNTNDNGYNVSLAHTYLNSTFLGVFDINTQGAICQIKLPWFHWGASDAYSKVYSGADGVDTKVFLLSNHELGQNLTGYSTNYKDGATLSYFSGLTNFGEAYYNGTLTWWWTRSPHTLGQNTAQQSYAYHNSNGNSGVSSQNKGVAQGYRPAFILPFNALFDKNTLLLKGVA